MRSDDVLSPTPIDSGDAAFQLVWTTPNVPADLNAGTDGPVAAGATVTAAAGDVIVQRGTNHLWRNPSPDTVCRIAFVLIAPVVVDGRMLAEIAP